MSLNGTANTEYASLSGKIHTLVIDKTLSISGAAADAKAAGDRMTVFEEAVEEAKKSYEMAKEEIPEIVKTEVTEKFDNLLVLTAAEIDAICV